MRLAGGQCDVGVFDDHGVDVGGAVDVDDDAVVAVAGAGCGEGGVNRGDFVAGVGGVIRSSGNHLGKADVAVAAFLDALPVGYGALGGKAAGAHAGKHDLDGLAFVSQVGHTGQLFLADGYGDRHIRSPRR